tara:strand:+ start:1148 stop:1648 length:501 start_codon:yes stop_codon:yes gene_type:complete
MTTDISIIRKELENFQEIKDPFKIQPNTIVKYITIKGDGEKFYSGGKMQCCKDNKIILKNNLSGREWNVPVIVNNYKSHFYIPIHDKNDKESEDFKLSKIIQTQQRVIDKMSIKNSKLECAYEEYKNRSMNYEELLQNNRYELKKYKINEKQLLMQIKQLKENTSL